MKKILVIHSHSIYTSTKASFCFKKEVIFGLCKIFHQLDFEFTLLCPQAEKLHPVVGEILKNEGVEFAHVLSEHEYSLFIAALGKANVFDVENSFFIFPAHDSEILNIASVMSNEILMVVSRWQEVFLFLEKRPRIATTCRTTLETQVKVTVNLDGSGKSQIETGIGFFNHMLEQIARHGNIDLIVEAKGDLHVDEHHTIEDIAITLGETFLKALGSKKGIMRYGFLLSMDDCLAQVAVDLGGRPWLVWNVDFKREKIGDMPTEMFHHFFKSFSDHARCNIHIQATGENEHHKIESIFKAFARSIQMAISPTRHFSIPSTKGVL
jgi:imidazoleglycerol-phosphate dehydratase/histidinol-phosphatase